MDTLNPKERSERMSLVRSKDTKLEMVIRRLIYSMGFRYRLHSKKLAGKPDLVFSNKRKVIFIHGCFWHRHEGCPKCRLPKTRQDYWVPKFEGNKRRDFENQQILKSEGWDILVIWECELKNLGELTKKITDFLTSNKSK